MELYQSFEWIILLDIFSNFSCYGFLDGLPRWLINNVSTCNAGDPGFIPGSGRPLGEVNDNSLQYSCLVSSMNREAWWHKRLRHDLATVQQQQQRLLRSTHHLNVDIYFPETWGFKRIFDINFSFKCYLLCNHPLFFLSLLTFLRLLMAKPKISWWMSHCTCSYALHSNPLQYS